LSISWKTKRGEKSEPEKKKNKRNIVQLHGSSGKELQKYRAGRNDRLYMQDLRQIKWKSL